MRLADKVAIVTGAASGIGLATAELMSREGAAVLLVDIDEDRGTQAASTLRGAGLEVDFQRCDVADAAAVKTVVNGAVSRFGGLDILHNNAADLGLLANDLGVVDTSLETWYRTLEVNLLGVVHGCRAAIPHMIERGGGSIVNTSSASSLAGDQRLVAYSASKAGVNALTRHIAVRFGKQGVRCNAIATGRTITPYVEAHMDPAELDDTILLYCTPRLGIPLDQAHAAVFLASDDAAFITGQVLSVDGGLLARVPRPAPSPPIQEVST